MPNIKLRSSDGEIFDVDFEVAKCSLTIKTMLESLGDLEEEGNDEVVSVQVSSEILRKVIAWASHHKDDLSPISDDDEFSKRDRDTGGISSWDAEFLDVDKQILFDLIMAANYLDIEQLLKVAVKAVALKIKGESPEGIRKFFNIRNDYSTAGEAQEGEEIL